MYPSIKESALRELIDVGSVTSARAVGEHGGFQLVIQCGAVEKVLVSSKGEKTRLFASLGTLAELLRRLGIDRFEVDTHAYEPGRIRKPRPDRAEALRRTRTTPRQEALL